MTHSRTYLSETAEIAKLINPEDLERMVGELVDLRVRKGRVFVMGLGGSASNASHFVNDLRRLCQIEAYCPTDNVSELTACANDDGWEKVLIPHFANSNDALFILSVGGGTNKVSIPIWEAIDGAASRGMKIFGIVGRDGGRTKFVGNHVILIPVVEPLRVTPHTESFQAVVWHCLVSHPDLQKRPTKW